MSVTLIFLYLCVQKCCVGAWSKVIHLYTLLFVRTRSCFYSKTKQMHRRIKFIFFGLTLCMIRRSFRPSSGVQDCTYSNQTDTAISLWQIPVALSFRPSSGVQDCTYSNQTDTAISLWQIPVALSFRPSAGVQDCTYSNQTDTAVCL